MRKPLYVGMVLLAAYAGFALGPVIRFWIDLEPEEVLLVQALQRVRGEYVEEIDSMQFVRDAMAGALSGLDDYSVYLPPAQGRTMESENQGHFSGIGIYFRFEAGTLTVLAPIPGSPADRAGLEAGDEIVAVDGDPVARLPDDDAIMETLRGPEGAPVRLTIRRPEEPDREPWEVTVLRETIRIESLRHIGFIDEEARIGYGWLNRFNDRSPEDLRAAIERLLDEGMRAFVLDLRGNPGGTYGAAVGVADLFLDSGVIVTERRRGKPMESSHARPETTGLPAEIPMAILVQRDSASASEIVAGALQDHGRATLVGERTRGKGSVQAVIPFTGAGDMLKYTVALWYTPSGRSISGMGPGGDEEEGSADAPPFPEESGGQTEIRARGGLEPDVLLPLEREAWAEILGRMSDPAAAGIPPGDPQRDRAVALLRETLGLPAGDGPTE